MKLYFYEDSDINKEFPQEYKRINSCEEFCWDRSNLRLSSQGYYKRLTPETISSATQIKPQSADNTITLERYFNLSNGEVEVDKVELSTYHLLCSLWGKECADDWETHQEKINDEEFIAEEWEDL